jgi:hypothetical protein
VTDFHVKILGTFNTTESWSTSIKLTGPLSLATMTTQAASAVTALFNTATDGLKNYMTSAVVCTGITVYQVSSATQRAELKQSASVGVTGVATGDSLLLRDAVLVEMYGAGLPKNNRGYMYFPPISEGNSNGLVWSPAFMASAKTVFDVFFPAIKAGGMSAYSFNRATTKAGLPPFSKTLMTSYAVTNKPSTQDRRVNPQVGVRTLGGAF